MYFNFVGRNSFIAIFSKAENFLEPSFRKFERSTSKLRGELSQRTRSNGGDDDNDGSINDNESNNGNGNGGSKTWKVELYKHNQRSGAKTKCQVGLSF